MTTYSLQMIFSVVFCYVLTIALIPVCMKIGARFAVDMPGNLKIHIQPTPRSGGLAIFCSVILSLLLFTPAGRALPISAIFCTGLGLAGIFIVGAVDDIRNLKPGSRLFAHVISTVMTVCGIGLTFHPPLALLIPICFFMVLYTNAFNLIDGMDGLAGGLACIVALAIAVLAWFTNHPVVLVSALLLAASSAGFLVFNLNPARIFLGDAGSTFIGFVLALLTSVLWIGSEQRISFLPLLALAGVPLLDTLAAIWRRKKQGKPIFAGDRNHLYDLLLQRGFTISQTLLIFYGGALLFASLGVTLFLWQIS